MELKKDQYLNIFFLIAEIKRISDKNDFNEQLADLLARQKNNEVLQLELKKFTGLFLEHAFFVNAFTDYGINTSHGFFSELVKRIKYKFFPPVTNKTEVGNFLSFLFETKKSSEWLTKINANNWSRVFSYFTITNSFYQANISLQLKNALIILSHRLVTLGVDPYIVQKLPEADDTHSPFFELNRAINEFVDIDETKVD
ncbi:MAG: hypothetical protein ABIP51_17025, partial [Bacteroidia bacterium]